MTAKEAVAEAERRKGRPRDASWTYRDAQTHPVGLVLRWDDPKTGSKEDIRPVFRTDDGNGWIIGAGATPRLLYRLPELLATTPGDRIYVVEGEKSTEAAVACGLTATTSPGGSKAAAKADWSPVSGRDVVILPDNDKSGEAYAEDVKRLSRGSGARSVRVIRLRDIWTEMPKGGDIADLLADRSGDVDKVRSEIEAIALVTRTESTSPSGQRPEPHSANESPAQRIVELVQQQFRLGQTHKHEPFAVRCDGSNVAVSLSGTGGKFKDDIAFEYRKRFGGVMNSTAFADALSTLRGEAMTATPEPTSIRVGSIGGELVLDLGTKCGAAVVVGASGGWVIHQRSPILFVRTALVGELPMPVSGGSLESLRKLLNVTEETWPILLGWLVAALICDIPHPILLLGGGQGSGKTTAARFICGLFDASDAPIRSQPRDPEAWAISVANSWATVIDNVSKIPDWWSDALCKVVTGDGWVSRKKYTDSEISVLSFKRVVALTSIDAGALRGDLGERVVLVDLEPIPEENRKTEAELNREYRDAHPAILGALLDLLAQVMSKLETVKLDSLPRMADFALVLAATDETRGTQSLALYRDQGRRIACDVVESDPVGSAMLAFMSTRDEWTGTSADLLAALTPDEAGRDWQMTPRGLAATLKRLIPALVVRGIEVTPPGRNDRPRNYRIKATVEPSANRRDEKPHLLAADGDCGRSDGSDGPNTMISVPGDSSAWGEL